MLQPEQTLAKTDIHQENTKNKLGKTSHKAGNRCTSTGLEQ